MRPLKNLSIKKKLIAIQFATACLVLLLASAAFVANDLRSFRNSLVDSLSSLAQVMGESSVSALIFVDAQSATQTLATFACPPA